MTGYLTLRYQGFPVSVAMVNNEPWFVGKDIARTTEQSMESTGVGNFLKLETKNVPYIIEQ